MGGIFGKSKQKSSSSNQAYPFIQEKFGGLTDAANTGASGLQALLSGDTSGFQAFKDATGFNPAAEQGSRGITGNAAASGLLRSGSTGKRLTQFGNDIQSQFADRYMQKLLQQAQLGLGAGSLIAGAGQTSTSTSKSKPGMGGAIGSIGSAVAMSDRRLKKNIKKLYERPDGLIIYKYNYVDDSGPFIGVMADEVKAIKPEALGPVINGYATVDYAQLGEL